jgi:putative transcriptional regulator
VKYGKGFYSIARGLKEAISHAKGEKVAVKIYKPEEVDVSELRRRMGMTQEQFAARFGFSVATLRHWERGDRTPQGAALVLLNVIKRAPDAVTAALS